MPTPAKRSTRPVPLRRIRDHIIILDSDLAGLYGVDTGQFNRAIKRNRARFPKDFAFALTRREFANLKCQNGISSSHGGRRTPPLALTEHGAIMAATILNSRRAVIMSLYIVRAFIRMREQALADDAWEKRLSRIEQTLTRHDTALRELFQRLRPLLLPLETQRPREIGFHTLRRPIADGKPID